MFSKGRIDSQRFWEPSQARKQHCFVITEDLLVACIVACSDGKALRNIRERVRIVTRFKFTKSAECQRLSHVRVHRQKVG